LNSIILLFRWNRFQRSYPSQPPRKVCDRTTYLSFDVDALDPAFAPGTGTPEVGGLATWQAQAILRRLENIEFVGMDVVEVAPVYDTAEITALAAATIVWEYLVLVLSRAPSCLDGAR
jgi:agmatinase